MSCDKEKTVFPYVPVHVTFSLSSDLSNLLVGQYKTINGYGLGGLIIYRRDFNVFQAFDRACTYEGGNDCILSDSEFSGVFKCPCCKSMFYMTPNNQVEPGSIFQGPANTPLKQYACSFDGSDFVTVRN
ncbi:MAG: hypothetical protein MI739_14055 [Bacteroidales bacterium]|nr:hypothetical protein [Bacteroidales bacterium]